MTEKRGEERADRKVLSFEDGARRKRKETRHRRSDDQELKSPVEIRTLAREVTFRRLASLAKSTDAVPPTVTDEARESFAWRSIDDELARLVYDSAVDEGLLTGVRSGSNGERLLTFKSADIVLEVEVAGVHHRAMTCQLVPPQPAELEVRHRSGTISLGTDEFGIFHLASLPDGPVSLRCIPVEATPGPASTSWVTL